jgi:hypothetical protein
MFDERLQEDKAQSSRIKNVEERNCHFINFCAGARIAKCNGESHIVDE